MRFAITATDRYQGVFEAFIEAGWQPVKLFSAPLDNRTEFNQSVVARAQGLGIAVQLSPMQQHDLQDLALRGCDLLVVASYNWRIGDWRPYLRHAVNFHPSPLPEGRGPYPTVRAILEQRSVWGVSCHRLEAEFDSGPILAQELFPLDADECHDSLDLKVQMASRRLAQRVAADLPALWQQARPQQGGSYWPRWTDEERLIDFRLPVAAIARHIRAFRCVEALARVNDVMIYVRRAVVWTEPHSHPPGAMVHSCNHSLVVAAADGYVGLVEWSVIAPDAVSNLGR
jgi:methionyl-tRNA formyltransferase